MAGSPNTYEVGSCDGNEAASEDGNISTRASFDESLDNTPYNRPAESQTSHSEATKDTELTTFSDALSQLDDDFNSMLRVRKEVDDTARSSNSTVAQWANDPDGFISNELFKPQIVDQVDGGPSTKDLERSVIRITKFIDPMEFLNSDLRHYFRSILSHQNPIPTWIDEPGRVKSQPTEDGIVDSLRGDMAKRQKMDRELSSFCIKYSMYSEDIEVVRSSIAVPPVLDEEGSESVAGVNIEAVAKETNTY